LKDETRYWRAVLVVGVRGFRRFGGRMGREVGGLARGVRRRRACLVAGVEGVEVWGSFFLNGVV
jgi:hypothetical protein